MVFWYLTAFAMPFVSSPRLNHTPPYRSYRSLYYEATTNRHQHIGSNTLGASSLIYLNRSERTRASCLSSACHSPLLFRSIAPDNDIRPAKPVRIDAMHLNDIQRPPSHRSYAIQLQFPQTVLSHESLLTSQLRHPAVLSSSTLPNIIWNSPFQ